MGVLFALQDLSIIIPLPTYPTLEDMRRNTPPTALIANPSILNRQLPADVIRDSGDLENPVFVHGVADNTYTWSTMTDDGTVLDTTAPAIGLLPDEISRLWIIRQAQEVGYAIDNKRKRVIVTSVDGFSRPKDNIDHPHFVNLKSTYPVKQLPLMAFGDPDLRALTLVSTIAEGQGYWFKAPGSCGKTWLEQKVLRALLEISKVWKDFNIHVSFWGERREDASGYADIILDVEHDPTRVSQHSSPFGVHPLNSIHYFLWEAEFVRRKVELGKRLAWLLDSASRLVGIHTDAGIDAEGGMGPGGIFRSSTTMLTQQIGPLRGYFPETGASVTQLFSVLDVAHERARVDGESIVGVQMSGHSTTGLATLSPFVGSRPWINCNPLHTGTRIPQGYEHRTPGQIEEMQMIRKHLDSIGTGPRDLQNAKDWLINYANQHLIPKWLNELEFTPHKNL